MMRELSITYYDIEVGRWFTQVIGTNDPATVVKGFKDRHDRVKVVERDHWWYNNTVTPKP